MNGASTHKALILQLDPDDDEAERNERMGIERRLERELRRELDQIVTSLYPEGSEPTNAYTESVRAAEAVQSERVKDVLSRALQDSADLGVSVAIRQLENVGYGFDYTLANVAARDWALRHTDTLLRQLGTTSSNIVGQAVGRWVSNGEPLPSLIKDLQPAFGKRRASLIAATEVTRAYAEGTRETYRASGVVKKLVWQTANDERRCVFCGGLQGKTVGVEGSFDEKLSADLKERSKPFALPPAHPGCRCWVVGEVEEPKRQRKPKEPKPVEPAASAAPVAPAVPIIPGLNDLTYVKELGGSTGAKLYQDSTGKRYVVKGGASEAHIQNEALVDDLYKTLGANVPNFRLDSQGGKTYKIAEYIDGKLLSNLSGAELQAARAAIQQHFSADVLLRSWDVIGLSSDNVIIDAAGKAWRIDNGGSLAFRAQGGSKAPSNHLGEIWTLRDKNLNPSAAAVFGDMPYGDIMRQFEVMASTEAKVLAKIADPQMREMIQARYTDAKSLISVYNTMSTDLFADAYIDRFSYAQTWIRETKLLASASQQLTLAPNPQMMMGKKQITLIDEAGNEFDNLRGEKGIYAQFLAEVDKRTNGEGAAFLNRWNEEQSSDSWSSMSTYVKQDIIAAMRQSDYWISQKGIRARQQGVIDILRKQYPQEMAMDAVSAMHALTYETLNTVRVGNRIASGAMQLYRTESDDVAGIYGFTPGGVYNIKRGPLESTSLLEPISAYGNMLTTQDVPIHRIYGFYGFGINKTIYLQDFENEMLAILDNLPVTYLRRIAD